MCWMTSWKIAFIGWWMTLHSVNQWKIVNPKIWRVPEWLNNRASAYSANRTIKDNHKIPFEYLFCGNKTATIPQGLTMSERIDHLQYKVIKYWLRPQGRGRVWALEGMVTKSWPIYMGVKVTLDRTISRYYSGKLSFGNYNYSTMLFKWSKWW